MSIAKLFVKVFEEDIFTKFGSEQNYSEEDDQDAAACAKEEPVKVVGGGQLESQQNTSRRDSNKAHEGPVTE